MKTGERPGFGEDLGRELRAIRPVFEGLAASGVWFTGRLQYTDDRDVIAAASLHDVLEDTDVTPAELRDVFGERVTLLVIEVTDVSRLEDGNRQVRKALDREHVARSSPEGATIKLADLIDNTGSIVKYDKGFARSYLREKEALLEILKHGNADLWQRAYATLQDAQRELVQHRLSEAV